MERKKNSGSHLDVGDLLLLVRGDEAASNFDNVTSVNFLNCTEAHWCNVKAKCDRVSASQPLTAASGLELSLKSSLILGCNHDIDQ